MPWLDTAEKLVLLLFWLSAVWWMLLRQTQRVFLFILIKTTSIIHFWGFCISLFPSTEQFGPVTCELTLPLHLLVLLLLLSSFSLTPTPLLLLLFPLAEARTDLGVTLCWGQRWRVLPAIRKQGGSLLAAVCAPVKNSIRQWKNKREGSLMGGRGSLHQSLSFSFVWFNFS